MADPADRAGELIEATREHALAAVLGRARAAHSGTGVCIDCGEPIAPARLAALPDAERCLRCQADHEGS